MYSGVLSEREQEILERLFEDNFVSVAELSRQLGVSEVTIRKTLDKLSKQGFIVRSYGGATPAFHPNIGARQREKMTEKMAIAKKAAAMINEGDTIMINSTTTGILIAKYLIGKRDINVVTNSTLILPMARMNPMLHLALVGGEFRQTTEAMVGPMALEMLNHYHARIAFIGTAGFSLENGITAYQDDESAVVKKLAQRSEEVVLVADSSKYKKVRFIRFLEISDVDMIITDAGLPDEAREEFAEHGIEVVIA